MKASESLAFFEPMPHAELVACIQADEFPGIDNQMKSHIYGPWKEYDYSDAFGANEARIESEVLCPNGNHEWQDDSYGGPESGCMAGHCTRCGFSFHHQLY